MLYIKDFQEFNRRIFYPFLLFALIISGFGVYQLILEINNGAYNVDASYRVYTFFAHRNLYAHILVLTIPILIGSGSHIRRFLWIKMTLISIILFLIFLLFSRTAWMSLVVATAITGTLIIINLVKNKKLKESITGFIQRRIFFSILGIFIVLATLSLMSIEKSELSKQFHNLRKWDYGSSQKRIEVWKGSFQLIREKPIKGHGTSAWKIEILRYISDKDISKENTTFYQRPHNDFLWVWSEGGSIAILLFIYLFFYLFRHFWKNHRNEDGDFHHSLVPLFGISAYVVIAFFSFPRERIEHGIFFSLFVVQALLLDSSKKETKSKPKWTILIGLILSMISLSLFYYVDTIRLNGELMLRQAFNYRDKQLNSEVIKSIQRAESKFFNMDYTSIPISWYSGSAFYNLKMYDLALKEFNKSLELNPYNINILVNAGSSYYKKGELDLAKDMYTKAFILNPNNNNVLINLSVIEFQQGHLDSSLKYLESLELKTLHIGQKRIIIKILDHKVRQLIEIESDKEKIKILRRMTLSRKWLYNLLIKSIDINRSFEFTVNNDVKYIYDNY